MKSKLLAVTIGAVLTTQLTACMGQMGLSQMVTKGNLSAVDNRYGRAGLFILLSPIYGIAATGDLFIVNTIEFWTGKNPITGKSPAVVDMPVDAIFKLNPHVSDELKSAPVKLTQAQIAYPDEQTVTMTLAYEDGSTQLLSGRKSGDDVSFFLDGTFIARVSNQELIAYSESRLLDAEANPAA
ncbi:MAG: DUF3332 domain-containing protein [Shewanella oncorhynchi]